MVHYVFWQPASQPRGGVQSLPATEMRLGAAPKQGQRLHSPNHLGIHKAGKTKQASLPHAV